MNTKIYDKIPYGGFHIGNGLTIHKEDNKEILSSVDVVVRYVEVNGQPTFISAEGDYASIFNKMFMGKPIELRGTYTHFVEEENIAGFEVFQCFTYLYNNDTKQIGFGIDANGMNSKIILLNPDNTWEEFEE